MQTLLKTPLQQDTEPKLHDVGLFLGGGVDLFTSGSAPVHMSDTDLSTQGSLAHRGETVSLFTSGSQSNADQDQITGQAVSLFTSGS